MSRQPRSAHIGGPVLALSSLCVLAMADAQPPPLHYLINAPSPSLFSVLQGTRTDAQAPDLSRDLRFASWGFWFPFHFAFSFCWKKKNSVKEVRRLSTCFAVFFRLELLFLLASSVEFLLPCSFQCRFSRFFASRFWFSRLVRLRSSDG